MGKNNSVVKWSGPTMAFELVDLSTGLKHGNISDLTGAKRQLTCLRM